MTDAILKFFVTLGLTALKKWLDARIAGWPGDTPTKERVAAVEAELIAYLEKLADTPEAKALLRSVAKAFISLRFPNDPTTETWG